MKTALKLLAFPLLMGLFALQSCQKEKDDYHEHTICHQDTVIVDDCHDPRLIDKDKFYPHVMVAEGNSSIGIPTCGIYQPVCGCDGVTYNSADEATYQYGIKKYTQGPCQEESNCYDKSLIGKNVHQDAWMYYAPVCGCDGVTYSNKDVAMYEHGIKNFTYGACDTLIDDCIDYTMISDNPITTEYAPVCGCNGVTYSNTGDAKNHGVKSFTTGPCYKDSVVHNDCYDITMINENALNAIDAIYAPVCGCDGVTYSSGMEAKFKYGVVRYNPGPCYYLNEDKTNGAKAK